MWSKTETSSSSSTTNAKPWAKKSEGRFRPRREEGSFEERKPRWESKGDRPFSRPKTEGSFRPRREEGSFEERKPRWEPRGDRPFSRPKTEGGFRLRPEGSFRPKREERSFEERKPRWEPRGDRPFSRPKIEGRFRPRPEGSFRPKREERSFEERKPRWEPRGDRPFSRPKTESGFRPRPECSFRPRREEGSFVERKPHWQPKEKRERAAPPSQERSQREESDLLRLFVSCIPGLESLLEQELNELGVGPATKTGSGAYIPLSWDALYKVNYASRLASRVLCPIASMRFFDRESLYQAIYEQEWSRWLTDSDSFSVDVDGQNPAFRNTHFAALVVKDAICDQFVQNQGKRPSINLKTPTLHLHLLLREEGGLLSVNTSGAPLYCRGWRRRSLEATLPESLAAGLLRIAGYSGERVLCDPFCGSGTLLIEAGLIATRTPSGYFRKKWNLFRMPGFSEARWLEIKKELDSERRAAPEGTQLLGADRDPAALEATRIHAEVCELSHLLRLEQRSIRAYTPPVEPHLVVTDPPYGHRLELGAQLYEQLKVWLGERTENERTLLFSADENLEEQIPTSSSVALSYGGLAASAHLLARDLSNLVCEV